MAKRLSDNQKEELIKSFILGKTIEELSYEFNCAKLTITRNLKKNIGEKKYKELINIKKTSNKFSENKEQNIDFKKNNDSVKNSYLKKDFAYENTKNDIEDREYFQEDSFTELIPLNLEIENSPQKDLTSISILDVDFPNLVYMIVDKKIELETKYLKDYPEWNFLSKDELNRKTIEIYEDLKIARRFCNKDQKVIKVPNTDVFKIVAPILISRGISRIVSPNKLIAL